MKSGKKYFIFTLVLALALISSRSFAVEKKTVLVLPFIMNSETDLSFLQKGISRMLVSRLTIDGKAVAIEPDFEDIKKNGAMKTMDKASAISYGSKYSADYVACGTVTVFGDSISTDAKFYDVKDGSKLVDFNEFGENKGDVIAHVNLFSRQVGETVFGHTSSSFKPSSGSQAKSYVPAPDRRGGAFNTYISSKAWKSGRFKGAIIGISVGDLDGDKKNEVVFLSRQGVTVCRKENGRLTRLSEIEYPEYLKPLSIDTADINGNGRDEIFVTCVQERSQTNEDFSFSKMNTTVRSFVLEWDGNAYVKTVGNLPWLFRVIDGPESGKALIGQKAGSEDKIFQTPVFQMKWNNGNYIMSEKLSLPKWVSVYGFSYGDVCNDGRRMIVALKKNGVIAVLDPAGRDDWTGADGYGGNMVYIGVPGYRYTKDDGYQLDRHYIKQRIFVSDMNGDGKSEVVVVKNRDKTDGYLEQYRQFDMGQIDFLQWNTLGLLNMGRTQKMAGYISDYVVADLDNDGKNEVVYSISSAKGFLGTGKDRSYIISQTLKEQ